jgi:hypothetical protein
VFGFDPVRSECGFRSRYGTHEECPDPLGDPSNCFIGVLFPTDTAPEKVFLRSGPSLLPRGDSGPTLAAFASVDPNAVGKASNASSGGREP